MNQYFKQFPTVTYTLPSGVSFDSKDLSIRFQPISAIAGKYLTTYSYQLKDGDRPDTIAHYYYGHADFAWLVLLSGQLYHYLDDFPMTDEQLDEYIYDVYGIDSTTAMTTVHHQEDADGDTVDVGAVVSVYDYEFNRNERKRYIKLISKNYLPKIVEDMDMFFRDIKKGL